ncbi:hypothetical protein BKI52_12530 [marine bacterium AO1-C]|nr:hypothetical protein BKI52_12530 [marine bacterium AO1-C]
MNTVNQKGGKPYHYPESWDELNDRKKAIEIAHIITNHELDEVEKKLAILKKLVPVGKVLPEQLKTQYDVENLAPLAETLQQVPGLDDKPNMAAMNDYNIALAAMIEAVSWALSPEDCYQDFLNEFQHQKMNWYGPSDYFDHVSFDEFVHCDVFAQEFLQTSDEHFLNCLVAVLYRPSRPTHPKGNLKKEKKKGVKIKPDGTDRREVFAPQKTEHYARQLADLPGKYKTLAWYYWLGCKNALLQEDAAAEYSAFEHTPEAETEEVTEELDQEEETTEDLAQSWQNIAWGIAKHDSFRNVEEVEQMNIRKLISFLQHEKMSFEQMKEEYEKQNGSTV